MYASPTRFALLLSFTTLLPCPPPSPVLRIFPSLFLPSGVPSGALLILGGPPTRSGFHHACLISPEGDYLLEHVTTSACHTPFPMASLTPAALDTLLHLLETPPPCSNKKRPHSAYRGLDPSLLPPPVITSPAVSIRGTTFFPVLSRLAPTRRLPRAFSLLRAGGHPCIRENVIPSI